MSGLKKYAPLIAILSVVFWYNQAFAADPVYNVTGVTGHTGAGLNNYQVIHPPAGITYTEFRLFNLFASSSDRSFLFKIFASSSFDNDITHWTNYLGQANLNIKAGDTTAYASSSGNTIFPFTTNGSYYLLWETNGVTYPPEGAPISENTPIANDPDAKAVQITSGTTLSDVPGIAPVQTSFALLNTSKSSLSWVYPSDGITTIDFPAWYLTAINASSSYSRLIIDYGNTGSSTLFLHDVFNNVPASTVSINAAKNQIFPLGDWWASAKLSDQTTGATIADAGLIHFIIASPTSTLFTTSSVSCAAPSSTLDVGGWVVFGMCGLFSPTQASLDALNAAKTDLSTKAPWGYITAASGAITSMMDAATSTTAVGAIASTFSGLFGPIRTLLAAFLWLIFVFWIFRRLKDVHQ